MWAPYWAHTTENQTPTAYPNTPPATSTDQHTDTIPKNLTTQGQTVAQQYISNNTPLDQVWGIESSPPPQGVHNSTSNEEKEEHIILMPRPNINKNLAKQTFTPRRTPTTQNTINPTFLDQVHRTERSPTPEDANIRKPNENQEATTTQH